MMWMCSFAGELWTMLLEAQNSEDGIPASMVEKKIREIEEKVSHPFMPVPRSNFLCVLLEKGGDYIGYERSVSTVGAQ